MRTEKIVLAGVEYEVRELPARKNAGWREKLQAELKPLADMLTSGPLFKSDVRDIQIVDIAGIVKSVAGLLMQSADTIRTLVYAYAPEVAKNSEAIEEGAYDSEYLDAFVKVLGMAYPFGSYVQVIKRLSQNGSKSSSTGMNSV